jgi:hypothetical protein
VYRSSAVVLPSAAQSEFFTLQGVGEGAKKMTLSSRYQYSTSVVDGWAEGLRPEGAHPRECDRGVPVPGYLDVTVL